MSAHTPGPWKVQHGIISAPHGYFITRDAPHAPERYGYIARMDGSTNAAFEREHNLKLIAAAPDLLAALEGVVRVADRATNEFDAALAAIARVRGES